MKILTSILLLAIIVKITSSTPVDKWHKGGGDVPTFFINTENKYNWHEAWNECALRNMSLVAVDTKEKHLALEGVLRKSFAKAPNLWLGGNDLGEKGKYVWFFTGKQFDFTNWSNGNPDNYNNLENCAHIWDQTDFEWNDGACKSKIGYICEENRFILDTPKAPNLWLGDNDLGENGKYVWSSTGKQFDFTNWSRGKLKNYKNLENCTHIWNQTDFERNDDSCNSKIGYICEENRFALATRKDFAIKKHFIDQLFEL